jgi:pimeloyl-ACP methyl ester carboxylesterase
MAVPTATVDGVPIHYFDDGPSGSVPADEAEVIMMVHGFARNGTFWDGWMPSLVERHRVIRPDIRGCGRNPDPGPDFVFRIEDVVADQIGLLDVLGIDRVHHVGESTGGIVGALAAAQHPDRYRSLTLVSTPITAVNSDPKVKSPGAATPEESLQVLGLADWWLQSRAMTDDLFGDERDRAIVAEFANTPVHVAVAMWKAMHEPRVSTANYLRQITAPTLLMTPTNSSTMTMDDQLDMVHSLPSVRHKIYEGASHGMYYLRADELSRDFLAFIDSL